MVELAAEKVAVDPTRAIKKFCENSKNNSFKVGMACLNDMST
jgi:hypothetical protein